MLQVANDETLVSITVRKAELLAHLADFRTVRYAADAMGTTAHGAYSQIDDLKVLCECDSVAELGRWWLVNRDAWVGLLKRKAGIREPAAG